MTERIAIYPISANPPTWGHGDIMHRAAPHFDHIYWAAAVNPQKKYLFSLEERKQMMQEYINHHQLKNVSVESYTGTTVRYAIQKNAGIIIKGLRSANDFYGESEQAYFNRGIMEGVETFCIFAHPQYAGISSSLVRELAVLGEDIEPYVLKSVADSVYEIINKQKSSNPN